MRRGNRRGLGAAVRFHIGPQDILHLRQMSFAAGLLAEKLENVRIELEVNGTWLDRLLYHRLCPELRAEIFAFRRPGIVMKLTLLLHPPELVE